MPSISGLIILLVAIVGVPTGIARFLIGGTWLQVAASYFVWTGMLLILFLASPGGNLSDKLGWVTILMIFLSIVAVPVLTLVLRVGARLLGG